MKKVKMIHAFPIPYHDGVQLQCRREDREVEVMAIVGDWAMVRLPWCVPYVARTKELREPS